LFEFHIGSHFFELFLLILDLSNFLEITLKLTADS
jgi:hypothetical protein